MVWAAGCEVERILDDVSNIWIGAVVEAARENDSYCIRYTDNGSLEDGVESWELRARTPCIDIPAEAWACIGACLSESSTLCALEAVATLPFQVSRRETQSWWCTAYHLLFGKCGCTCTYERNSGLGGTERARLAIADCLALRSVEVSGLMMRRPWKERFAERSVEESTREATDRGNTLLLPQKKPEPPPIRMLDGSDGLVHMSCLGLAVGLARNLGSRCEMPNR